MQLRQRFVKNSDIELKKILNYLNSLLSKYSYSRVEILKKLERKTKNLELRKRALEILEQENLINDKKVAQDVLEKYTYLRRRGRYFIKRKLLNKGVDSKIIQLVLAKRDDGEEERLALAEARRLIKIDPRLKPETLFNRLLSRGFSKKIIYRIMDNLKRRGEI